MYICDALHDLVFGVCVVVQMHPNAFLYLRVVSIRLHELPWHSKGSMKCQTFGCHSNG